MSTRCQIQFVSNYFQDGEVVKTEKAQVYRHSDGYPESIVPDLDDMYGLLDDTMSGRGASYSAAVFIFLDKLGTFRRLYFETEDEDRRLDSLDPEDWDLDQLLFLLGHGVEDPAAGIHGDEEFLYRVVEDVRGSDNGRERRIMISNDFPTWDDEDTDVAFEKANWRFEGTFEEAFDELFGDEE
jgi:hypothetical protein